MTTPNAFGPHDKLDELAVKELKERGKLLATSEQRVTDTTAKSEGHELDYVCFRIMEDRYALPLAAVSEIISLRSIVPVPGAPTHVVGITRIRGKALALVNLRAFLFGETIGWADSDSAVVIDHAGIEFGLVSGDVEGLLELSQEQISEVPGNLPPRVATSLRGLARREILLVDLDGLLGQPGFIVRQTVKEA